MKSKSRAQALEAAYRKHQSAIQTALELRARAMTTGVVMTTDGAGTWYKIGCGPRGFVVLGVEQGRRAS